MELAGQTLHVNGLDLNVVIAGQGPEVMLVHGVPDTHAVWRKQIPPLVAAGYRVIAPDLRGFGESEAPRETSAYRVDHLVDDLVGLLERLGVERVRLIGHDLGSIVGWRLCMQAPERVDRFVALSVGHPSAYARSGLKQKLKAYYILFAQARNLAEFLLALGDWWLFRLMTRHHEEFERWRVARSRPGRLMEQPRHRAYRTTDDPLQAVCRCALAVRAHRRGKPLASAGRSRASESAAS